MFHYSSIPGFLTRNSKPGTRPAEALARAYSQGDYGLTPDAAEAARWRDKGATGAARAQPPASKATK